MILDESVIYCKFKFPVPVQDLEFRAFDLGLLNSLILTSLAEMKSIWNTTASGRQSR
jgi:hypothetical protein